MPELVQDDGGEVVLAAGLAVGAQVPAREGAVEVGLYFRAAVLIAGADCFGQRGRVVAVVIAQEIVGRTGLAEDPAGGAERGPARVDMDDLARDDGRLPDIDRGLEGGLRLGREAVVSDLDIGRGHRRRPEGRGQTR